MLILFDIDGTLLKGNGVGRIATRAAMLEIFGTAAAVDMHAFGGKTDWYTLIELLGLEGISPDEVARKLPDYERSLAVHMAEAVRERGVVTLPGALEAVNALRQQSDKLLGLVTGNLPASVPIKLRAAGFDPDWFPVGAFGSEAIDRNDLPPIALARAIHYTGREITPHEVTVIGDTLADIECGRALGARVIAVTTGFESRAALADARPDVLLDDLTTLLDVL